MGRSGASEQASALRVTYSAFEVETLGRGLGQEGEANEPMKRYSLNCGYNVPRLKENK